MVTLVLGQELVPLQDPSDGWSSNYGFWVRTSILVFVGIPTLTIQATYFIDGVKVPVVRLVLLSFVSSVSVVAGSMAVCAHLPFPVPFFLLAMFPVLSVVLIIAFRVIIGTRIIHQIMAHRGQLTRYLHFVNAKCLLIFIYPAYEALFHAVHGTHYQFLVILFLPVMKTGLKNIMRRRTAHMEDMTPETVIFTVDLFNSIYMATCIQRASSLFTITVIMVVDLSLTLIMLYGIHHCTVSAVERLRHGVPGFQEKGNMLEALCLLCRDVQKFKQQSRSGIRIYSCLPYKLDAADERLMVLLDKAPVETSSKLRTGINQPGPNKDEILPRNSFSNLLKPHANLFQGRNGTIHPDVASRIPKSETRPIECVERVPCTDSYLYLKDTLETLFTMECLVIASYLETVIPFFYTVYILVIVHLPSARYHFELVGIILDNVGATVLPVFVFALLQVVSLALLVMLIQKNCGMRAVYQLVFVLETQMPLVQGKLMFWMTCTFRV
ncbi:hypothetical protein GN244_ATG02322 [Phytophthora infestans]|uniref:Transmembrane protein n=1 Tax=Phytophthora infestans TaxID=4787 RepID=A0A833T8H5_PHYIN|nr:hypothetical protein GN244_ATG02322 [Phytophthora infestans]KAF4129808.1 hypothetical protein GN958_ATG21017 [Phytophthora infestans]